MKNPFKKSSASADIAAELNRLKGKRADVQRRVEIVGEELAAAKAARLEILDSDDATIAAATNAVREAQSALAETNELIRDFDKAVIGAEQRLADARDREGREAEAKRLEKIAAAIEKRRPDFEKAVAALVTMVETIAREVPSETGVASGVGLFRKEDSRGRRSEHPLSGREAVVAAMLDGICAALPGVETKWLSDGRRQSGVARLQCRDNGTLSYGAYDGIPAPMNAGDALNTFVIGRLRAEAAVVLAGGESPGHLAIAPPAVPQPDRPDIREVEIIAKRDFAYVASINLLGKPVREIVPERKRTRLPEPIATRAVKAGVAFTMDSHQGQAAYREEQERLARPFVSQRVDRPTLESCHDLGDVLDLARAWREEFAPLRTEEAEEVARAVG